MSWLKKISFFDFSLLKKVAILAGGTAISQILVLASMPIITRLYRPEAFGAFSVFGSLIALIGGHVALRYEMALPKIKGDDQFLRLFFSMLVVGFSVSLFFFVIALYVFKVVPFDWPKPSNFDWAILYIGVIAFMVNQGFLFFYLRRGNYLLITKAKILLVVSMLVIQFLSAFQINDNLLIIGYLIGLVASNLYFIFNSGIESFDVNNILEVLPLYRKYPAFVFPSSLINTATVSLPVVLFAALISVKFAGFYALAQKIIIAPVMLIGTSFGQVFYAESSKDSDDKAKVKSVFSSIVLKVCLFVSLPLVLSSFIIDSIFELGFGSNWITAGKIASYLIFISAVQVMVTAVSTTPLLMEKENQMFYVDLVKGIIVLSVFLYEYLYGVGNGMDVVLHFCIASVFCYLIYLIFYLRILFYE